MVRAEGYQTGLDRIKPTLIGILEDHRLMQRQRRLRSIATVFWDFFMATEGARLASHVAGLRLPSFEEAQSLKSIRALIASASEESAHEMWRTIKHTLVEEVVAWCNQRV